jgi:hypothetical protein
LRQAGAEHRLAHQPQALRRQLQADDEQQQDHAELGELRGRLRLRGEVQDIRANQHAGGKVAKHGTEAPAARQRHRDDGRDQIHHDVLQIVRRFHALLRKIRQV